MTNFQTIASLMLSAVISSKNTHWQNPTNSYGVHYSIDTFVDEIWDTLDKFVEVTSGIEGTYEVEVGSIENVDVQYLENLDTTLSSLRLAVEQTSVLSIIDDFQNSIKHLIYRLNKTV